MNAIFLTLFVSLVLELTTAPGDMPSSGVLLPAVICTVRDIGAAPERAVVVTLSEDNTTIGAGGGGGVVGTGVWVGGVTDGRSAVPEHARTATHSEMHRCLESIA